MALSSALGGIGVFYGTPQLGDVDFPATEEGFAEKEALAMSLATVFSRKDPTDKDVEPISLMTATPSRTVFPRGFLWDEGFHQMLISNWDADITIRVLSDWLSAMYKCDLSELVGTINASRACSGGWIPREMILGAEARKRVPNEFVTQRVNVANPPTLLLVVESLLSRFGAKKFEGGIDTDTEQEGEDRQQRNRVLYFLNDAFPALDQWVQWFLNSQRGGSDVLLDNTPFESFRWRGRSAYDRKMIPNTLSSGLDDYPRAPVPSENERHLDLYCWMARACAIMASLGEMLIDKVELFERNIEGGRLAEMTAQYRERALSLSAGLESMHWSEEHKSFLDFGLVSATAQDRIAIEFYIRCGQPSDNTAVDIFVDSEAPKQGKPICPTSHPKPLFQLKDNNGDIIARERYVRGDDLALLPIPRVGYVNLFPLLLKLLPVDSPRLPPLLDILASRELLWSGHGLRSMATNDMFYRKRNAPGDEPYWR